MLATLSSRCGLLMLVASLSALCGCGQAEYERRMGETEARIRQASKFLPLSLNRSEFDPFTIRLPSTFAGNNAVRFTPSSPDPYGSSNDISPDLLQPPQVKLPGIRMVLQTMGSDSMGVQYPYFCYVAVVDAPAAGSEPAEPPADQTKAPPAAKDEKEPAAAEKPAPSLEEQLLAEVQKAFPTKPGLEPIAWRDELAETPDKKELKWRRLSATGEQSFQFIGGQPSDALAKVPGIFEIYLYDFGDKRLLVAWREPQPLETAVPLATWAHLAAGTVEPR